MSAQSIWARFRAGNRRSLGSFGQAGFGLWAVATWVPVVILFNTSIAELLWIDGPSMYPYFNAERDQTLRKDITLKWRFKAQENLARGMIVVFSHPQNPEMEVVKRIVGVEGDIIRTREPYPSPTVRVPPGHIWVEGDGGARDSLDSNNYGPISTALVTGKITHILYPFHRAGKVKWWEFARNIKDSS